MKFSDLPIGAYFIVRDPWTEIWQKTEDVSTESSIFPNAAYSDVHGQFILVDHSNAKIVDTDTKCFCYGNEYVKQIFPTFPKKFNFLQSLS